MKKIIVCITLSLFICSLTINAQTLNTNDIKTEMVKDWERAKAYTI